MKIKQYFTKKNIIIICIAILVLLSSILTIYLYNNTTLFKNTKQVQDDLLTLQQEANNNKNNELDIRGSVDVDNKLYSDDVGVSNGTLYIKENAESKVKEAAKNTSIGYAKSKVSSNGILEIEPYSGTNAISCKVVNSEQDVVTITAYNAQNLCENTYIIGSIKDFSEIEKGNDNLLANPIKGNTTYTISNSFGAGINTIFFFDKDYKFINSTTKNTFITPENAAFFKVITNFNENKELNGLELKYCLVLGTEAGNIFATTKTVLGVESSKENEVYFPMESDKIVAYVDGGEIEVKYVSKE